jgi:hypothetical protein
MGGASSQVTQMAPSKSAEESIPKVIIIHLQISIFFLF